MLIRCLKTDWVNKSLLPEVNTLLNSKNNYLERTTGLYCLQSIAECSTQDFNREKILPLLVKSVKDPIPNVRFITAKIFKSIAENLSKQDQNTIVR